MFYSTSSTSKESGDFTSSGSLCHLSVGRGTKSKAGGPSTTNLRGRGRVLPPK